MIDPGVMTGMRKAIGGKSVWGALLAAVFATAVSLPAWAQTAELDSKVELRICADPSNLPLSNQKGEGFENKIAQILGKDLKLPVTYVWFPQVIGFVRNTLMANKCDLVMGTVAGDGMMDNTNPYYHTAYVIVTRADSGTDPRRVTDPALLGKQIGLIAGTPPTDALVRHNMMDHVTSYSLTADTRFDSPSRDMAQDVADKKLDAGLLWGPFAGYYIKHDHLPLKMNFLESEGGVRLDYHISMGVRANEPEWRRRINAAITRHQDEITAILRDYGVPLLNEQNQPIPSPAAQ